MKSDVLAWPDRARPEHSKKTVTHVPGLKCYQPARLQTHDPGIFAWCP
jgi:hypothetical protein